MYGFKLYWSLPYLISAVTVRVSVLVGIHIGIESSAIGLKTWEMTAGTKKYKSIIK